LDPQIREMAMATEGMAELERFERLLGAAADKARSPRIDLGSMGRVNAGRR
jgi:hypothetical protein